MAHNRPRHGLWVWGLASVCVLCLTPAAPSSGRIILRDGMEFTGDVALEANRIVIRSGPRVIYVGTQQLLKPEPALDVEPPERIALPQQFARKALRFEYIPEITQIEEFDDFGRRSLTLNFGRTDVTKKDVSPRTVNVIQVITELFPTHAIVRGVEYRWETSVWLSQLRPESLVNMLQFGSNASSPPDQLKVANFLIQAAYYEQAKTQLDAIAKTFPDSQSEVRRLTEKLERAVSERALMLANRAISVGQIEHAGRLAGSLAKYPVPTDLKEKLDTFNQQLAAVTDKAQQCKQLLERSRFTGEDSQTRETVQQAIDEISDSLSLANQARLGPLLSLGDQASATVQQRAALAMSGWVLGQTLATTDLGRALALWRQRQMLQLALGVPGEARFQEIVHQLKEQGGKADIITQMIAHLPAPATDIKPNEASVVSISTAGFGELSYHVLLPPEYDRYREYQTVVALHGDHTTPQVLLEKWGAHAKEHGTIVVAPEYRPDRTQAYAFSVTEHLRLLEILNDVRRRFAVDADRVFLTGHEIGGIAAWDVGMSHPDQFAGLVPFTASPRFYCDLYWPNLRYLPVYVVEGGMNGGNPETTQQAFLRYFANGFDAIYVDYPGRSRELFSSELPTIYDWMSRKRRQSQPLDFNVVSARHSDRSFYWLEAESFLPKATIPPQLFGQEQVRPAKLAGRVSDSNAVHITASGLGSLSLLLPPTLVHLDDPDLVIRVNRKIVHRGAIDPDLATMLRELRRTGDRKRLIVYKTLYSRF